VRFIDGRLGFSILTREEIVGLIDMLYGFKDRKGTVWNIKSVGRSASFNGHHMYNPNTREHTVSLCEPNIRLCIKQGRRDFGGDAKIEDIDERKAMASVLSHEIQHANQTHSHRGDSSFYGYIGGKDRRGRWRMRRYKNRECEIDARRFADERMDDVMAYLRGDRTLAANR